MATLTYQLPGQSSQWPGLRTASPNANCEDLVGAFPPSTDNIHTASAEISSGNHDPQRPNQNRLHQHSANGLRRFS